jgi:hypothetical protein
MSMDDLMGIVTDTNWAEDDHFLCGTPNAD